MTVIPPASRARAPRRRSPWRSLLTGCALALAMLAGTPAAVAATPEPTETPSGELEVTLAPGSNGVVHAGQPLMVTVSLDNGTAAETGAARVTLAVGDTALPDRAALDRWLGEGDAPGALRDVGAADLPSAETGTVSSALVSVGADDPAIAGRGAGVYPLRATVDESGETLVSTSVMVVPAEGAATTPVSVVVPITAGPLTRGLLNADAVAELTAEEGALTATLDAVANTGAILAIDPAVPAAIRVLGDAAPAAALEWLERLESLPNSRFALQYGDADVAVQVAAGLPAPLQPTSLLDYMSPDDFTVDPEPSATPTVGTTVAPSPTAAPTATPTEAPAGPVYPDLAELTSIGDVTPGALFWPVGGTADGAVVAALGALGQDGGRASTLIPSTSTTAGADGRAVPARATSAGGDLLIYDSGISADLSAAASEDSLDRRAALLASATARLAFATAESAGSPLLIALDRDVDRPRTALRAAVTAATSAPGATALALADLVTTSAAPVELAAGAPDPARVADTSTLVAEENDIAQFATILDDPALLTGPERAEILQILGVAWARDAAAAHDAVVTHRAATATTLESVRILPGSVFNLISYTSELLPTVRNDLPYPVTLDLVAQPDDPRLVVEERTDVRAQPESNTRVKVPVESRVGNGAVTVALQLYSPTGVVVGTVESAEVEVRAEWETYGLVAIVVLIVLFLGLGVFRTIRARRARKAPPEPVDLEPSVRTDEPGA